MTLGKFLNLSVPPVSIFYKMGMIIKTFFKGLLGKFKKKTKRLATLWAIITINIIIAIVAINTISRGMLGGLICPGNLTH